MADIGRTLLILIAVIFLSVSSLPIDLFNTDSPRLLLPRPNTGSGLCRENIGNDNITNIKWYRYHNETRKCWHIDERGPCGALMLFYPIGDSDYGDCDCNLYYRCARPIIYWPPAKRCYYTNDQGPCGSHEWILLNDTRKAVCELNPCKRNETEEPSTIDRYWFEEDGQCYKTLTQGYCGNPQAVLYPKWDDYKPSCNVGRICNARNTRSSSTNNQDCIPGQKTDQLGKCQPIKRVTWWFPTGSNN